MGDSKQHATVYEQFIRSEAPLNREQLEQILQWASDQRYEAIAGNCKAFFTYPRSEVYNFDLSAMPEKS